MNPKPQPIAAPCPARVVCILGTFAYFIGPPPARPGEDVLLRAVAEEVAERTFLAALWR